MAKNEIFINTSSTPTLFTLGEAKFPPISDPRTTTTTTATTTNHSNKQTSKERRTFFNTISQHDLIKGKIFKKGSNSSKWFHVLSGIQSTKNQVLNTTNETSFSNQNMHDSSGSIGKKQSNFKASKFSKKFMNTNGQNQNGLANTGINLNTGTEPKISSQVSSLAYTERSTNNNTMNRIRRESIAAVKNSPSQDSKKPRLLTESDEDNILNNRTSFKILKTDPGITFNDKITYNGFANRTQKRLITKVTSQHTRLKPFFDNDEYYGDIIIPKRASKAFIDESRMSPNIKQQEKRKNLGFQVLLAKKSIKSNKFSLRVFVTLLKNMKHYYQCLEDSQNNSNKPDSLQKLNTTINNNTVATITTTNNTRHINYHLINGNVTLLQESFETLLIDLEPYIEVNNHKVPGAPNQAGTNQLEVINPYFRIKKERSICIPATSGGGNNNINDREVENKEKSQPPPPPPHEVLYSCIQEIILLIDKAIMHRKKYSLFEPLMKKMVSLCQQSGNIELQLSSLIKTGRILLEKKDYQSAITILKQYKNSCYGFGNDANRLKAYKNLGKCYQNMQKYKVALVYYTKMLQLAWHSNNKDYEMLAYDLIGMQYYYIGELEKAQYYHEKMVKGQTEENQSLIQLGIQKIKSHSILLSNTGNSSDALNLFSMNMMHAANGAHHNNTNSNAVIEDGIEISSGDEFELPIPDYNSLKKLKEKERIEHDKLFNKKELEELKRREIERIKSFKAGLSRIYNKDKQQSYQQAYDHNPKKLISHNFNIEYEGVTTEDLNNGLRMTSIGNGGYGSGDDNTNSPSDLYHPGIRLKHNQANPKERIFLNHLSRNRGLDNFDEICTNIGYTSESKISSDQIDAFAAEKFKKILEKYRRNLVIIKNGIEAFFHLTNNNNKETDRLNDVRKKKLKKINFY